MSHPSASTGALLDWWTSACCLLANRTCLILLDCAPTRHGAHAMCTEGARGYCAPPDSTRLALPWMF
eukprot:188653-Chlamydomonas_euryale.AAC.1